jgi:hypothetical protein
MRIFLDRIRDFRRASGQRVPQLLFLEDTDVSLALALVEKQVGDFIDALYGADATQAVTEWGHLEFVVLNLAIAMGIQYPGDVLDAIIDSNNTRLIDKRTDDDGRLLKGHSFTAPEPTIRAMLVASGDIKG